MDSKTKIKVVLASGLFLICLAIMQLHAIPFWERLMGTNGISFSLTLEAAALWHWWHKKIMIGLTISFLLISGPLAHLSEPLIKEFQSSKMDEQLFDLNVQSLKDSKVAMEKLLSSNWAGMLQKNLDRKQKKEDALRELLSAQKEHVLNGQIFFYAIMHAIALIVVLITQIHLLQAIRYVLDGKTSPKQLKMAELLFPVVINKGESFTNEEELVSKAKQVYEMLINLKKDIDGNWKDVSEHLKIPQSNISRIKNLLEGKADVASEDMLIKVYKRILDYRQ